MRNSPKSRKRQFQHFGAALRHYRETISDRLNLKGLPQMQVTATALLKCVEEASGVVISQASYSDVENGVNLPRDPGQFLHLIAPCLAIEEESFEWWVLVQYVSHDLIAQKFGMETADKVVILDEDDLKEAIRQRREAANSAESAPSRSDRAVRKAQ